MDFPVLLSENITLPKERNTYRLVLSSADMLSVDVRRANAAGKRVWVPAVLEDDDHKLSIVKSYFRYNLKYQPKGFDSPYYFPVVSVETESYATGNFKPERNYRLAITSKYGDFEVEEEVINSMKELVFAPSINERGIGSLFKRDILMIIAVSISKTLET